MAEQTKDSQAAAALFLPMLFIAAGLALWTGFQSYMLWGENRALTAVHANQEPTVQQATKVRAQLDSIAARTQLLAEKGNAGASLIVAELKKRGVTINPNAKPPAPAAPVK